MSSLPGNPPSATGPTAPPDFETALARMEAIVYELEEGRIGLAEAGRYEEGVGLLRQCFGLLETAERRIELLTGVDAAGNPVVEPYDDTASADRAQQGTPRSRSRSTPPPNPPRHPDPLPHRQPPNPPPIHPIHRILRATAERPTARRPIARPHQDGRTRRPVLK